MVKRYNLKNFIKNIIFRYVDDEVSAMSSQLAYSLLLSFFPFLILLLTILGYSSLKSEDLLALLNNLLPSEVYHLVKKTVTEIVSQKRGGLLSLSMISTVWTAANGFNAVIRGLNKAYDEKEERSFIKVQLTALLCTFGLALIIVAAFALIVFGEIGGKFLVKHFNSPVIIEYIIDFARFFIGLLVMVIIFNGVYKITPSKKLTWKETFPGAVFTTIGWTIISLGFSFYVNNFGSYSKVYGGIGAIIALMSWLYLSSIIVLLGGEINAIIAYKKLNRSKQKGKKY